MSRKLIPVVLLSLLLYGCPKQQKFVRPALPVPDEWPARGAASADTADSLSALETGWRDFFADSRLQAVIGLALSNNRDLRVAVLNVEKAREFYRIRQAGQYPPVSFGAGVEAVRTPGTSSSDNKASTRGQYTAGLGVASWELDLFGRVRNLKQQALEQYLATEQARTATRIALVATVAATYLELAAGRENLRLAQATLDAQLATLDLIQRSRDLGIASDLDVSEARSQVDAVRVEITRYNSLLLLVENALDLAAGAPVPAELKPDGLDGMAGFPDISAGLPSEVLFRRPDILLMEHRLNAAAANIGAARAAFFPRITLTAAGGLASRDLSDLFKLGALTWSFVPQLVLPLFDHGARQANLEVAQTEREILVAEYEKTIQIAFREVSDALGLRSRLVEQQQAGEALLATLEETNRLAEARYRAGLDGYLNVLVVQRSLFRARQALVDTHLARRGNLVSLYKVLGGGVKE